MASLLGLVYGYAGYYASMPRYLGGGAPAEVILLFKKDADTSGLPFPVSDKHQSPKLTLLMELNDGILIEDKDANVVVEIKNDLVAGKIADLRTTATPTPQMQTQTPSPTATSTPTP